MTKIQRTYFPFALVFYEILLYLANDMYIPAMPQLMKDFAISKSMVQYSVGIFCLGSALTPLFLGVLADWQDKRKVLCVGLWIFVGSLLTASLSTDYRVFMMARFIQGACIPSIFVTGYAVIHECFDRTQAIAILALMNSISVLAPAMGPYLGAWILVMGSWQMIFLILGFLSVAIFLPLWLLMPQTSQAAEQTLHQAVIDYRTLLLTPAFMIFALSFGLMIAMMMSWISQAPFTLIDQHGMTAKHFGMMQLLIFSAMILGNHFTRWLIKKVSIKRLLVSALVLFILAICGFMTSAHHMLDDTTMVAWMMLFALSFGLASPNISRLAMESSCLDTGKKMGLYSTIVCLFTAIGSSIVSLLPHEAHWHGLAYVMFGFAVLLLCLLTIFWSALQSVMNVSTTIP